MPTITKADLEDLRGSAFWFTYEGQHCEPYLNVYVSQNAWIDVSNNLSAEGYRGADGTFQLTYYMDGLLPFPPISSHPACQGFMMQAGVFFRASQTQLVNAPGWGGRSSLWSSFFNIYKKGDLGSSLGKLDVAFTMKLSWIPPPFTPTCLYGPGNTDWLNLQNQRVTDV